MFAVVTAAVERARTGGGPTMIEGLTYRMESHTNSDDPTRYRTAEETADWAGHDPIDRLAQASDPRPGVLTRASSPPSSMRRPKRWPPRPAAR